MVLCNFLCMPDSNAGLKTLSIDLNYLEGNLAISTKIKPLGDF